MSPSPPPFPLLFFLLLPILLLLLLLFRLFLLFFSSSFCCKFINDNNDTCVWQQTGVKKPPKNKTKKPTKQIRNLLKNSLISKSAQCICGNYETLSLLETTNKEEKISTLVKDDNNTFNSVQFISVTLYIISMENFICGVRNTDYQIKRDYVCHIHNIMIKP